jgi:GTP-binding protein EngB required for normal cell division
MVIEARAQTVETFPERELAEIAFAGMKTDTAEYQLKHSQLKTGRSNVGKSSLLNALLGGRTDHLAGNILIEHLLGLLLLQCCLF